MEEFCTHSHQREGHVDRPDPQCQVLGLIHPGLVKHLGGVVDDLEGNKGRTVWEENKKDKTH